MKLKMLKDRFVDKGINLEKDKTYEVDSVVVDSYRIAVPMKRKGKFKYALVGDDEAQLLDE
jgi:hypothetical protein